jgi:hypothetical protein
MFWTSLEPNGPKSAGEIKLLKGQCHEIFDLPT